MTCKLLLLYTAYKMVQLAFGHIQNGKNFCLQHLTQNCSASSAKNCIKYAKLEINCTQNNFDFCTLIITSDIIIIILTSYVQLYACITYTVHTYVNGYI